MSAVFADTFYFLGLVNRADEAHDRCVSFSQHYRGEVVTTEYVLVEVADALATPERRLAAARFIQSLQTNPRVRIVAAATSLLQRGFELYAARADKDWSLTDCLSFIVMTDAGITDAATGAVTSRRPDSRRFSSRVEVGQVGFLSPVGCHGFGSHV